jgi:hypothetical protein
MLCKNCGKTASFGRLGDTSPTYCKNCKEPDMLDIKHKKCIKCGERAPAYGKEGKNKFVYCSNVKNLEWYLNTKNVLNVK